MIGDEQAVWGPDATHGLRDLWRGNAGDGPPFTHTLRSGAKRRFDYLWASPDIAADAVSHLYDDALEAGSDHALVLTTITRAAK